MQMNSLAFDISHTLAGGLVLISFMMLYQDRLYSLLNVFALHAVVLALSVALLVHGLRQLLGKRAKRIATPHQTP